MRDYNREDESVQGIVYTSMKISQQTLLVELRYANFFSKKKPNSLELNPRMKKKKNHETPDLR